MNFKTFIKTDLIKTRKADLIELCLERGLNASGLKKDLIATLVSFQPVAPVIVDAIPRCRGDIKSPLQSIFETVTNIVFDDQQNGRNWRNDLDDSQYSEECRTIALVKLQAILEGWMIDHCDDRAKALWSRDDCASMLSLFMRDESFQIADATADYEVRLRTLINS